MGGSSNLVFKRKMSPFSGSFSVFVASILHTLFRFFSSIFVRFDEEQSSLVNESYSFIERAAMPQQVESEVPKSDDDSEYYDVEDEKETPEPSFVFKFEYQTKAILEAMEKVNAYGHSSIVNKENELLPEKLSSRRYAFQAEKHVSFFEEEPKVASFVVREASADNSNCGSMVIENDCVKQLVTEACVHEEEEQSKVASFVVKEESADNSNFASIVAEDEGVQNLITEECVRGKIHIPQDPEKKLVGEEFHLDTEEKSPEHDSVDEKVASHEDKFLHRKEYVVVESSSDYSSSLCSSPELSILGRFSGDGFLSETEFGERVEFGALEDIDLQSLDVGYEPDGFDEEDEDIMEQLE
ncbi:uncharacterized protein LOC126798562 [Argentina anserina]|uniref:uncharacterized protein LOC126798562 n=1 Tax=Argentina anserina TaxID=57926 RepID=UPI0021762671|nr:uncharacterized protein LOC126798562 [Potentilla anserina]XP_050381527.1 uncharacterized protein LOC126798562 [Potentilla anserina]